MMHSEVVWRVSDPVGQLIFGAFGRAVGGEEGFVSLRFVRHVLDGPLAARGG